MEQLSLFAPRSTDRCQRGRAPTIRDDGSIEIPLTQGQVTIVSPELYPLVRDRMWCAKWCNGTRSYYADSKGGKMHRFLFVANPPSRVDHINHDTLDNRRGNLRAVTPSQNMYNRRPNRASASRFKGVCWHRRDRCWEASIRVDKHPIFLGYFKSETQAAHAYDAAARQHHGAFSFTNHDAGLL